MSFDENAEDFTSIVLKYSMENFAYEKEYLDDSYYMDFIKVDIIEEDLRKEVGSCELIHYRFNEATKNRDGPPIDIADSHSQETYNYIFGLFSTRRGKQGVVKEKYRSNASRDVLAISRFFINPEYRKTGVSKQVVESITRKYSTICGPIVVCPFPLQISADKSLDCPEFSKDKDIAIKKVTLFWKSVGFRTKVIGTDNLIFDRSFIYKE